MKLVLKRKCQSMLSYDDIKHWETSNQVIRYLEKHCVLTAPQHTGVFAPIVNGVPEASPWSASQLVHSWQLLRPATSNRTKQLTIDTVQAFNCKKNYRRKRYCTILLVYLLMVGAHKPRKDLQSLAPCVVCVFRVFVFFIFRLIDQSTFKIWSQNWLSGTSVFSPNYSYVSFIDS